jgi:hypothetical protein
MMENKKDEKKIPYEPPKAVRLVDTKEGRGVCVNGSGDGGICNNGNAAGMCGYGNSF